MFELFPRHISVDRRCLQLYNLCHGHLLRFGGDRLRYLLDGFISARFGGIELHCLRRWIFSKLDRFLCELFSVYRWYIFFSCG